MVGTVTHSIIHYYNLYIHVLKTILVFSLKHIGNWISHFVAFIFPPQPLQVIFFYLSCVPKTQHSKTLERFCSIMPTNSGLALR